MTKWFAYPPCNLLMSSSYYHQVQKYHLYGITIVNGGYVITLFVSLSGMSCNQDISKKFLANVHAVQQDGVEESNDDQV